MPLLFLINGVFFRLLRAPTRLGRKVLDEVEGFRMYLSAAEKERLKTVTAPPQSPALFEKYLPYALALDVEQKWAEQFAAVFAGLKGEQAQYSPAWYSGRTFQPSNFGSFTSSLSGSFASAISSSSTSTTSSISSRIRVRPHPRLEAQPSTRVAELRGADAGSKPLPWSSTKSSL